MKKMGQMAKSREDTKLYSENMSELSEAQMNKFS